MLSTVGAAYCGTLAKGMHLLRCFLKGYAFQNRIRTITPGQGLAGMKPETRLWQKAVPSKSKSQVGFRAVFGL